MGCKSPVYESCQWVTVEGPNTEKGRTSMSSHNRMNPYGGVSMGRIVESFDPNERLLERIISRENMETGWKRVKANPVQHGHIQLLLLLIQDDRLKAS